MKRVKKLCVCVICLGLSLRVIGLSYERSVELCKEANAWKKGQPIPTEILEYRTSHQEGSCFPDPTGTESIFYQITNYPALKEILFSKNTDARVFTNAANNAMRIAGPTQFFKDVLSQLNEDTALLKMERFRTLKIQSKIRHIVVDSLYISYADMPAKQIIPVLDQIEVELKSGMTWSSVYKKWADKFETPYEYKVNDGRSVIGHRTKIGNLGDFILPENRDELFSFRESWMPKEHLPKLMSAKANEILILFDKEDLTNYPDLAKKESGERYILYRIREIWAGSK